ncbi:hypothetical protein BD289DRAFT_482674 [Coniella lustricola]|uniref:Uncharacterized protein n=1 Tax=Coniella lustricola TaxID=2025994 RepID=A0A2T3A868_9PEZI|nr:hypothetical protein BD289DRAFT_482674 [Coniella lustricola]
MLHCYEGLVEASSRLPVPDDGRGKAAVRSNPDPNSGKSPEYHPLPAYMGNTFTAICGLWTMADPIIGKAGDSLRSVHQPVTALDIGLPDPLSQLTILLWHTGLLYVANVVTSPEMMLNNPAAGRAWFQLCLSGYRNMLAIFAMVEEIVQGLLG